MKSIWRAYTAGLSESIKNFGLIFLLYLVNLVTAYLMSLPVSMMLSKALEKTTASAMLFRNFDITFFRTILADYGAGIDLPRLLFTFGLVYIIFNIFLAGGIFGIISGKRTFSLVGFLRDCMIYMKRFFTLYLYTVLLFLVLIIVFLLLSGLLGTFNAGTETEFLPVLSLIFRFVVFGILIFMLGMVLDYTRIIIVANDNIRVLRSIGHAFIFMIKKKLITVGLYILFILTMVLILAIYLMIESVMQMTGPVMMILFALLTQVYIFIRIALRIALLAGQFWFYRSLQGIGNQEDPN